MLTAIIIYAFFITTIFYLRANKKEKDRLHQQIDCLRAESDKWEKQYNDLLKMRNWSEQRRSV